MVDDVIHLDEELKQKINNLIGDYMDQKIANGTPIRQEIVYHTVIGLLLEQLMESGAPLEACINYLADMLDSFYSASITQRVNQ